MPHSHPEHKNGHSDDSLFKGLVMGVVIGAGILWLLGTEEGKKIKKQVLDSGEDLLNAAKGKVGDLVDEDDVEEELPKVTGASSARKPAVQRSVKPLKKPISSKRFFRKRR